MSLAMRVSIRPAVGKVAKAVLAPAEVPVAAVKLTAAMFLAPRKAFKFLEEKFPQLPLFLKVVFSLVVVAFVGVLAFLLSLAAGLEYVASGVMGPGEAVVASFLVSFIYPTLIWLTDLAILRFSIRRAGIKPRLLSVAALRALSLVPMPLRVWAEFADLRGRIAAFMSGRGYMPSKPPVFSLQMLARFYGLPADPLSLASVIWGATLLWKGVKSVFRTDGRSAALAVLIAYAVRFLLGAALLLI